MIWRALYPPAIHFAIGQVMASLVVLALSRTLGSDHYYSQTLMVTGIAGILTLFPAVYLYKKDRFSRAEGCLIHGKSRRLTLWEGILLLAAGAALAQYVSLIVGLLMFRSQSGIEYRQNMDLITQGKGVLVMILWMGVVAPVAEESIFRWLVYLRMRDHLRVGAAAVLSGLFFGIYHGNLIQGIYASIMGAALALLMEWSGSLWASALLHIGANVWSILLNEMGQWLLEGRGMMVYGILLLLFLVCLQFTFAYFDRQYRQRGRKRLI